MSDYCSLLRRSAISGDIDTASQCLESGCAVDALDSKGWTALMLAASYNQKDMIVFLANKGADIDVKNQAGRNALHYGIKKRHLTAISTLLSCNANPNIPFINSYLGVDFNPVELIPQTDIEYPLIEAVNNNDQEVTKLILQSPLTDVNVASEMGHTAVMYASYHGDNRLVKVLYDLGANINYISKVGGTALMTAMYRKKFKTATLLLDLGADPDIQSIDGETAYGFAVKYNRRDLQKYMKSKSSSV